MKNATLRFFPLARTAVLVVGITCCAWGDYVTLTAIDTGGNTSFTAKFSKSGSVFIIR